MEKNGLNYLNKLMEGQKTKSKTNLKVFYIKYIKKRRRMTLMKSQQLKITSKKSILIILN